MSSVNWGGNHGSAKCSKKDHIRGVNLLKHCDQTFRADPTKQHSNIEIDPSKSYQNQNFTGMTWKESREKWEKRLAELNRTTNTNKRDDRIEMMSLEIPVLLGMITHLKPVAACYDSRRRNIYRKKLYTRLFRYSYDKLHGDEDLQKNFRSGDRAVRRTSVKEMPANSKGSCGYHWKRCIFPGPCIQTL